jgi:aryl-alcohol dehydrogenase-like predicted oxidoreductase
METPFIPGHPFGTTGIEVTRVGLGGEGVLRTHGRVEEARTVIREALAQGIRYFDSARAYAGSQGYYGSVWQADPSLRPTVFQASKSARRDRRGALADLEETLKVMGIDYLDLWQIHDVRTDAEIEAIAGPGGALEAFLEARSSGKVRFIGVTGHHDPSVLTRAVREWPVDSVMMPVSPVEAALGGFLDRTLPLAREKGVAVIGLKILGASQYVHPEGGITAEILLRYALSQGVTVAIAGCSSPEEVRTLAGVGRGFQPLTQEEQQGLVGAFRPYAKGLAFYRGRF